MKRQKFIVLSIVTIISSFFPAMAFAEDYIWSDNGDGTCTITECIGPSGAVTIPDTLGDLTVIAIGDRAFQFCYSLTSVAIPDSVTSIGRLAFYYCGLLTSVTIPDSVTSIESGTFSSSGLTSVTIGNSVTSIGYQAFYQCYYLTSVTIPDSVTSIGGMAFASCYDLTSVTIGNSVTSIGEMAFYSCSSLTSVTIPDSVTSIGRLAFHHCSSLVGISVDVANPAFSSVASVLFNKSQTELIKYPGAKAGAYTIPGSVTTIGEYAFSSCSSLTSVTIPDSVTSIRDGAFSGCSSLVGISVDVANPAFSSVASILFNKSQTELIQHPGAKAGAYTIPDSVTTIRSSAFNNCSRLTSVMIPDSVTTIRSSAFLGCSSLTSVTIPDSVTSIGSQAFSGCSSLTSVTIPDSITTIESYTFYKCTSLISITIGDSVAAIQGSAFKWCSDLIGIYFKGDAPGLGTNVFTYDYDAIAYYLSGTTGWEATYGGLPTALWQMSPVGMEEFSLLAQYWQMTGCDETQPCYAADWYIDGTIDMFDLNQLAMSWLSEKVITDSPISDHVFEIEMSLSYDYGEGYASSVPVEYQFDAWMWVDDTVVSGTVETPEGVVYTAEMEVDDGENWLGVYAESASLDDLSDFTDGVYIFTVTYTNGSSQSTSIPFLQEDSTAIPPVDQVLVATYPVHNAINVPLTIDVLLTPLTNPDWTYGIDWFPEGGLSGLSGCIEDLPYTTTIAGPLNLSPDTLYEIELTANHVIRSTNDDGIPYVVDKDSEVEILFTTVSAL